MQNLSFRHIIDFADLLFKSQTTPYLEVKQILYSKMFLNICQGFNVFSNLNQIKQYEKFSEIAFDFVIGSPYFNKERLINSKYPIQIAIELGLNSVVKKLNQQITEKSIESAAKILVSFKM